MKFKTELAEREKKAAHGGAPEGGGGFGGFGGGAAAAPQPAAEAPKVKRLPYSIKKLLL